MPADNEPWALNDDGWEPDEDGEAWAEDGEDWAEDGEDWAEDGGTSGSATPEPVPELFEAGFLLGCWGVRFRCGSRAGAGARCSR